MSDRIVRDPYIMGGRPYIRGSSVSVDMVLEGLAGGASRDELAGMWPGLSLAELEAAVEFAREAVRRLEDLRDASLRGCGPDRSSARPPTKLQQLLSDIQGFQVPGLSDGVPAPSCGRIVQIFRRTNGCQEGRPQPAIVIEAADALAEWVAFGMLAYIGEQLTSVNEHGVCPHESVAGDGYRWRWPPRA